jgi:hypothetical protein
VELSHENDAPKSIKSHKEISQRPTKSRKIPIQDISYEKSAQHKAASHIRVGEARNEGGRTLIKLPWPAMKPNSNFTLNQLLSPLLNVFTIKTKPPTIWKRLCLVEAQRSIKSQTKSHNGQKT